MSRIAACLSVALLALVVLSDGGQALRDDTSVVFPSQTPPLAPLAAMAPTAAPTARGVLRALPVR